MISFPQPCIGQKLRAPTLPPSFVSRPRLSALLDATLCNRIVLMHAPAGFGKTTAAASWARTTRTPNAWLCLDELDRDPSVLAANVVQAVRNLLSPNEGESLPAEGTWESPQRFVAEACSALERIGIDGQTGSPCVLVLDNCHVIEGVPRPEPDSDGPSDPPGRNASAPNRIFPTPTGEAHALLALMVGHMPPWLHVLLISRTEAIGDAASLALQGGRTEIGIDELRATKLESDAFWRKVPEAAGNEDALFAYTNGWPAAMALIAAGWANAVPDAQPAAEAPDPARPRNGGGSKECTPS